MREMTDKELERAKAFLDYFHVSYDKEIINLTNGGTSVIMNPTTRWKEFLGFSINQVAEAVAKKLNKKTKWLE